MPILLDMKTFKVYPLHEYVNYDLCYVVKHNFLIWFKKSLS